MGSVALLASGIAHDFNNILTSVVGYGDIIKHGLDSGDPLQNYADRLLASAERAGKLSRSLLSFAGKQEMEIKPADLNALVLEASTLLMPSITRNAGITLALSPEPIVLSLDTNQIEQVLVNLVLNARDAMPAGGTITISTGLAEGALPGAGAGVRERFCPAGSEGYRTGHG